MSEILNAQDFEPQAKVVRVEKSEIFGGQIEKAERIVKVALEEIRWKGTTSPCDLTISGYDLDSRPLAEIPEVRSWYIKVHSIHPYLPVFLSEFSITPYILSQMELVPVRTVQRDLSESERAEIDKMVSDFENNHPGKGKELRGQLETATDYAINAENAQKLFAEISLTGRRFLENAGVKTLTQNILIEDTFSRIQSALDTG
ncbi:MAG TPA: chlororespiratory reduction 6 domain-containing protein [Patescibacteria group bacterium]|nr:chlororespiratory reduction 6 domain-containing protein [Patescibacteria group bacterium]